MGRVATVEEGGPRASEEKRDGLISPGWQRLRWPKLQDACGLPDFEDPQERAPVQEELFLMAEQEAMRDLEKPIQQLLSDIHEQGVKKGTDAKHVIESIRRMSSMMAKVAISNRRLNRRVVWLTWVLVGQSGVVVLLTAVLVWLTVVLVTRAG